MLDKNFIGKLRVAMENQPNFDAIYREILWYSIAIFVDRVKTHECFSIFFPLKMWRPKGATSKVKKNAWRLKFSSQSHLWKDKKNFITYKDYDNATIPPKLTWNKKNEALEHDVPFQHGAFQVPS